MSVSDTPSTSWLPNMKSNTKNWRGYKTNQTEPNEPFVRYGDDPNNPRSPVLGEKRPPRYEMKKPVEHKKEPDTVVSDVKTRNSQWGRNNVNHNNRRNNGNQNRHGRHNNQQRQKPYEISSDMIMAEFNKLLDHHRKTSFVVYSSDHATREILEHIYKLAKIIVTFFNNTRLIQLEDYTFFMNQVTPKHFTHSDLYDDIRKKLLLIHPYMVKPANSYFSKLDLGDWRSKAYHDVTRCENSVKPPHWVNRNLIQPRPKNAQRKKQQLLKQEKREKAQQNIREIFH